jgi:hypothetical protein
VLGRWANVGIQASKYVAGLSREQAQFILETARKGQHPTSVTFGGSRVRGNYGPASDVDIGFDELTMNQATKLIGKIRRNARETGGVMPEEFQIVPGRSVQGAAPIQSSAEFFQRSGIRTAGPRAGEPFGPSGYVTFTPNGRVILVKP